MAKRTLRATVPEKESEERTTAGQRSKQTVEEYGKSPLSEIYDNTYDNLSSTIALVKRIEALETQIKVITLMSRKAGGKLITPSKVDSILRKMYGLPVQAGVKKLIKLVGEKVQDPEHAYFIIRHQRDKKLLDAYYSILSEDNFPTEPTEEA